MSAEANPYCEDDSCDIGHDFYICPMHPEIRQDHPGVCTKCGITKRGDHSS